MPSLEEFEETFWERHSNPKSGWSRVLVLPVLLYAVYHRSWKLAVSTVVFTAINPLLFSSPESNDAWMTQVVLAERWWTEEQKQSVIGVSYPNILNLLNIPVTGYSFVSAYRKQPIRATLGGLTSMMLKFWYVRSLVRRYNEEVSE
ncbi:DUF6653 family protein [Natronococcus jeotgali]|uniref:DUF6653 family protein n=1 Tax=Natronococcus jeotgali TaxID=413812 RepID=UPI0009FE6043|nr:DUF6653 family protein [Natronococcus jeotgali]